MPTIPVRDLARGGIIRDVHPTAYPLPAFSNGRNVLFADGKAASAPIWRRVTTSVGSDVRFVQALTPDTGFDKLVIARDDASLRSWVGGTMTDVSETGFSASTDTTSPWTACSLGNVFYINRRDRVPRSWVPGATRFTALPNWDSTWRCRVLRQFNDTLLALNVTKGATDNRSMVKVSDLTLYGAVPTSWDSTNPATLAYENPLAQLDGPIVDGMNLGDRFLFYTANQCWEMRLGGPLDYTFRKVSSDDGAINANCAIELNGLHYVFGSRDIYATDGVSRKAIGDGRVRQWLYRTMNTKLAYRNFVAFNPVTNEVIFAHVSGDPACAWRAPTGCNAAVTYNLTSDTVSLIDLPNISAMTLCNLDSVMTFDTSTPRTFNGIGGSFFDQEDSFERQLAAVAAPLDTPGSLSVIGNSGMVLGYDFVDRGQLAQEAETTCNAPRFVERTGIALDSPQEGLAPLRTAKEVHEMLPEVSVSRDLDLTITLGGHMTTSGPIVWETPKVFNPITDYKVDSRAEGRYLAVRFDFDAYADTEISGFDLDVLANGDR